MRLSIIYRSMFRSITVIVSAMALFASACSDTGPADEIAILNVVTTSNIVADWARNVGGNRVEVFSLLPPEADPHSFRPGAQDVTRVADADLVLSVGLSLEAEWLSKLLDSASADNSRVVALGESVDPIVVSGVEDPHFWLDPLRVKMAVLLIEDELSELDPDGAAQYGNDAGAYIAALDEIQDWTLKQVATLPVERRLLATTHDSLRYFADTYGFTLVGATFGGNIAEQEPSAEEMARIVDTIVEAGVDVLFVETAVNDRLARTIAEETGAVIVPGVRTGSLAGPGSGAETYLSMLRSNVELIVRSLQ
jgi:ABC-type Zn uptake system ZnuABC Zn-binding protein ZnuA